MIEALFLDRDGVINEIVMRDRIVSSPRTLDELKIRKDFSSFYQKVSSWKIPLFVVSNQPDVRRNLMSRENLNLITEAITREFPQLQFFYCLHDNEDLCNCRKPKPGLISHLLEKHSLRAENSVFIGDGGRDVQAGLAVGVKTVLLSTQYNGAHSSSPDYQIKKLEEFFSIGCT